MFRVVVFDFRVDPETFDSPTYTVNDAGARPPRTGWRAGSSFSTTERSVQFPTYMVAFVSTEHEWGGFCIQDIKSVALGRPVSDRPLAEG